MVGGCRISLSHIQHNCETPRTKINENIYYVLQMVVVDDE